MSNVIIYDRIQLRQGTAADLATVNEAPLLGEPCMETDTGKLKIGDGVTNYISLPYLVTLESIVAGTNVSIDASDPANPVISATGGGGGGTEPDHPSVIYGADLVCCIDPRTLTSASDGDLIALVEDSGAAGNDFTSSGAARPTFVSAAIAGQASLLCSRNQFLSAASALIPADAQCTVGFVFSALAGSVNIGYILAQFAGAMTGRLLWTLNQASDGVPSAGLLNPFIASATAGIGSGGLAGTVAFTDPSVITFNNSGAAEGAKIQQNSRQFDSFTCSTIYIGANTEYGGYTGMAANGGTDGLLGPLVIVNRPSTATELLKLQSWLRYYARR